MPIWKSQLNSWFKGWSPCPLSFQRSILPFDPSSGCLWLGPFEGRTWRFSAESHRFQFSAQGAAGEFQCRRNLGRPLGLDGGSWRTFFEGGNPLGVNEKGEKLHRYCICGVFFFGWKDGWMHVIDGWMEFICLIDWLIDWWIDGWIDGLML